MSEHSDGAAPSVALKVKPEACTRPPHSSFFFPKLNKSYTLLLQTD